MASVVFLFLAAVLMVGYGEKCADELKEFQSCVEQYAKDNPPQHPPRPQPPDFPEIMDKMAECFTNNNCQNPVDDMTPDLETEMPPTDTDLPPEPNGIPEESGPPPHPPRGMGRRGRGPASKDSWLEKKKAKWECKDKIAKEDFEPIIQTCVQKEIPGWTFPVRPANRTEVFDPYGEGPLSKQAMFMKFKHHHKHHGPPGPPMRTKRFAPHRRGPPPHHKMFKKIASAIFDEDVCPKSSRDAVSQCVISVAEQMHDEKCSKLPAPPAMMVRMMQNHVSFCENRQTCFDKISDECESSFWDQKWYIARCFDQHAETMDEAAWEAIELKFKECMRNSGIDDDSSSEEDDDEDSSSSEERGPWGQRRKMKVRFCLSKRFRDGPVRNPCKKVNGAYEMFMGPPHHRGPPHHGGPPPFGGCGRGPCGRRGPPFGMHGPPHRMHHRPPHPPFF